MLRISALAAAVAVMTTAGTASAVLVDFDTLPGGGAVANNADLSNEYAAFGVTFELFENGVSVGPAFVTGDFEDVNGGGQNLRNVVDGIFPQDDANRADVLRMTFLAPVRNLSFDHNGIGDRTVFEAFDINGVLLETFTSGGGTETFSFLSEGIARLDALQAFDDFNYAIDNLQFSPVPLPAALPLLAGGLGLFGLMGWRRKRATA